MVPKDAVAGALHEAPKNNLTCGPQLDLHILISIYCCLLTQSCCSHHHVMDIIIMSWFCMQKARKHLGLMAPCS
jgi:hypothetical protein